MNTDNPQPRNGNFAPDKQNPYSSPTEVPDADAPDAELPKRPLTVTAIVGIGLLTLLASSIAFCCTCFPLGFVSFSYSYGAPQDSRNMFIGNILGYTGLGLGFLAACVVGYFVARSLWRRRSEP